MRHSNLIMLGWLASLFGCGSDDRYFTAADHKANVARQTRMTPSTMAQLRQHGVKPESELKLEYFFYTDTDAKAATLERSLLDLGYSSERDPSASGDGNVVVTGWTTRVRMLDATVVAWTEKMCELGYDHDAVFDGWGTYPKQD